MFDVLKQTLALAFVPALAMAVALAFSLADGLAGADFELACLVQKAVHDVPRAFLYCPANDALAWVWGIAVLGLLLAAVPGAVFRLLARRCGCDRERNARLFPRLVPWAVALTALTTLLQGTLVMMILVLAVAWVFGKAPLVLMIILMLGVVLSTLVVLGSLRNLTSVPVIGVAAVPVGRGEAPALWRLVDDIAGRLGSGRPDTVLIGLEVSAWVASRVVHTPGQDLDSEPEIHVGRALYLSLPMMAALEKEELAAIVAHELGHFRGGDVLHGTRLAPAYQAIETVVDGMEQSRMPFEDVPGIGPVFGWLFRAPTILCLQLLLSAFHANLRAINRERELEADRACLEIVPREVAAQCLLRSALISARFNAMLEAAFEAACEGTPVESRLATAFSRRESAEDEAQFLDDVPSQAASNAASSMALKRTLI
ncbi:MAG: M48 family metalloprotease, partial [Pseudomonadota bacterium]